MILLSGIFLSCTEVMSSTRFQSLLLHPTLAFQIHFSVFKCLQFGGGAEGGGGGEPTAFLFVDTFF